MSLMQEKRKIILKIICVYGKIIVTLQTELKDNLDCPTSEDNY